MVKKSYRFIFYIIVSAVAVVVNPLSALAVSNKDLQNIEIPVAVPNSSGANLLTDIAAKVINIVLLVAGILAVIYLIISGITYVTAGGDSGKAEKGRTGVVNAVIGIIIIVAAFIIVRFVTGIFQVDTNGTNFAF